MNSNKSFFFITLVNLSNNFDNLINIFDLYKRYFNIITDYCISTAPKPHIHAVVLANQENISHLHKLTPNNFILNIKPLKYLSDVAKARKYIINNINVKDNPNSVKDIYYYNDDYSGGDSIGDLEVRVNILEDRINAIEDKLNEILKKLDNIKANNVKKEEVREITVELKPATFKFVKSKKGIGIVIKFANYIKPKNGEYFISLSIDEIDRLINALNQAKERFIGGSNTNKPKIEVENGFNV